MHAYSVCVQNKLKVVVQLIYCCKAEQDNILIIIITMMVNDIFNLKTANSIIAWMNSLSVLLLTLINVM